jgi:large subunit ribosomal protein L24
MHVKTGDLVKVISGRDKNLGPARVLAVNPGAGTVVVEGRNLRKRHLRGNETLGTQSRILEVERPFPACKVALYSEKVAKPVRTSKRWLGANAAVFETEEAAVASYGAGGGVAKKVRYCAKTQEIFE